MTGNNRFNINRWVIKRLVFKSLIKFIFWNISTFATIIIPFADMNFLYSV